MLKRCLAISAIALSTAFITPAAQAEEDVTRVLATVNGQEITLGHVIVAYVTLPEQYRQLPDEVLYDGILTQLIQQTALAQAFDGDLPPRVTLSMDNEQRSLIAGETLEAVLLETLTEENLLAEYRRQYVDSDPGKEFNASHILVETEEEARAIIGELENGADFAVLAQDRSTGPSGPNGGSLGWFGEGMMVAPFEQAVLALDVGQVSEPVQTQFGWHVIILNDTRVTDVPQFEEVREEMETQLRDEAVQSTIDDLVRAAEVEQTPVSEIVPSAIRDVSLLQ